MGTRKAKRPVSLSSKITEELREQIFSTLNAGDRLPTQDELAARYKVSVLTVREAIAPLVNEGLIERRRRGGSIVTGLRSGTIALYTELDTSYPRGTWFANQVLHALRTDFEARGETVRIYTGRQRPGDPESDTPTCSELVNDVQNGRVRGLMSVCANPHPSWMEPLQRRRAPVVGTDPRFAHFVEHDRRQRVEHGLDYLLNHGRRRIALMGWGPEDRESFQSVAAQRGLTVPPEWIACEHHPVRTGTGVKQFRRLWDAHEQKPDGMLVLNDFLLLDALLGVLPLGIQIPDQLLIASIANKGDEAEFPFQVPRMCFDPARFARVLGNLFISCREGSVLTSSAMRVGEFEWIDRLEDPGGGISVTAAQPTTRMGQLL
jgi:DNA-binding LacI/PurR family transcriptional regulator